ncbi:ABC-2 transporter permease [Pseudoclostridium thermosuccinogenes]|jgi:ABC-type transport system involved in multi-copper enzyme maturation permease subunit|uniref:ABC-2 transporter permease n=1 Tax=Clostridium thermosuccinogenes TaxID=84032 RepID=UPI002FDA86BB
MLYSLIVKDLLIQKRYVAFSLLYLLALIFAFQNMESVVFSAAATGVVYILLTTSCAYDEKNKTDIMINSLPIKRSQVVAAKYLAVYVFFLMATVGYIIFSNLLLLSGAPIKVYPMTLDSFMVGMVAISIMTGLNLPVFFKFGFAKSRIVGFLLFFCLFFGVSYIMKVFQEWERVALDGAITKFIWSQGDVVILLLKAVALLAFIALSYGLSVKFYKNREF